MEHLKLEHVKQAQLELLDQAQLQKLVLFPHIVDRAKALWGTKQLDIYLDSLLLDDLSRKRRSFPPEAASAIWALSQANRSAINLILLI
jgi:hypothetical protein